MSVDTLYRDMDERSSPDDDDESDYRNDDDKEGQPASEQTGLTTVVRPRSLSHQSSRREREMIDWYNQHGVVLILAKETLLIYAYFSAEKL